MHAKLQNFMDSLEDNDDFVLHHIFISFVNKNVTKF